MTSAGPGIIVAVPIITNHNHSYPIIRRDEVAAMRLLIILEIIGTIAFAISGAIVGIQKHMDIFGVAILGLGSLTVE